MASETATGSNIEIVREYTERVFNQHSPDLAAKYLAPGVTWHGQTLGTIKGADNVTGMLRGFIGALPDLHAAEQDIVAAGDKSLCATSSRRHTRRISWGSPPPVAGCAGTPSTSTAWPAG
jgi:limonene-1,2-epoxide hydrolase